MTDFTAQPAQEVNTTTAGDQFHVVVAPLAGGGHVVAWTSSSGTTPVVMAQVYDASGAKSGGELTLANGYSVGGIAALADGSIVVNMTQTSGGADGPHSAVSFARFDLAGHALGAPVLVDGSGNYDVALQAAQAFALPDGGFALVEASLSRPTPVGTEDNTLHFFDAAGNARATVAAGQYWMPQLGIDETSSGGFVTVSDPYTGPGPSRPGWTTVDSAGTTIASNELRGVYMQNDYIWPSVLAMPNGTDLVTWQFRDYTNSTNTWQAQWIDASGHAGGSPFTWNFAGASVPTLTPLAGGGFVATWTSNPSQPDLFAQTFDASAQATSGVQHLATLAGDRLPDSGLYSITPTSDGGFLLDYEASANGADIFEQKFNVVPASSGGSIPISGDTMTLSGSHTQYTVSSGTISGPQGTISLSGIDRVHFGDGFALALDVNGNAGEAFRLYQAAFDRAPDLPGLGFHINDLDHGVPLWMVAEHFIDSPEFQTTYGATDNTQFITLLYANVLHRGPDQGGLQFHLDEFAHGESRADMLIHFSESPENQANVIGQIGDGMLYVPIG